MIGGGGVAVIWCEGVGSYSEWGGGVAVIGGGELQ